MTYKEVFTYFESWNVPRMWIYYMSGVPKDIYYYSLENSFFFFDWAETFFLHVLDH